MWVLVFVLLIRGFIAIEGAEPDCPRDSFQRHVLENVIETKVVMQQMSDDVEKVVKKLDERIDEKSLREMQNEMKNITRQMGEMDRCISDLQKKIDEAEKVVIKIDERIDEKSFKKMQNEMTDITLQMSRMDRRMSDLQQKIDEGTVSPDQSQTVAVFSVGCGKRIRAKDSSTIIKFDTIFLNQGNHYNAVTGEFTAPTDGIYAFWGSMLADNGAEAWGSIRANNHYASMYARGINDRHDQGSASLIIAMKKGDVATMHGGPKLHGGYYTAFNGYLLHKQ